MMDSDIGRNDRQVLLYRGKKNSVDPYRPYAMLVEPECSADGVLEDVLTVFLSNRECPFRCLMCDLWKNTTDETVPVGAVPQQIRTAIAELPASQHIKLYNSGNFFDVAAFPREDLPEVAKLVSGYKTVVVENHPKLCNDAVLEFQQLCGIPLEVAIGLETSHEPTLARLNKKMTTSDFAKACEFLLKNGVRVRAFVLLRPPWTTERQGIERAIESVRFAFDQGVNCCAVIPTRSGNGVMEQLQQAGQFEPPALASLETVVQETLGWQRGRVFADLWDLEQFSKCPKCFETRRDRLQQMNLSQVVLSEIECGDCNEFRRR